jgi:hypothetical protein
MTTAANTSQEESVKTTIAEKEPDLDLVAPLLELVFKELPLLKQPILDLLTEVVPEDAWKRAFERSHERTMKRLKQVRQGRRSGWQKTKIIKMDKEAYMDILSEVWDLSPDREFVKGWAIFMLHGLPKGIENKEVSDNG